MASNDVWHKCLKNIPQFTSGILEQYIKAEKDVTITTERAYKFFLEGFIHDFEVSDDGSPESYMIRGKCYHSQKKRSSPHNVQAWFSYESVERTRCSCAAGRGLCHHAIALLYQLQHYKRLGLKTVPVVQSKTSLPQQWHIPSRQDGLTPETVPDMVIQQPKKKKKSVQGVSSTLYNAVENPLDQISVDKSLLPLLQSNLPTPQYAQIWSLNRDQELVNTKFGQVPKGSILSYQLKEQKTKDADSINIASIAPPHYFDLPMLVFSNCVFPLKHKQNSLYWGLETSQAMSVVIEQETRSQSETEKWHQLRQKRLTASVFKRVCIRKENFNTLTKSLGNKRRIQTAKMKYGLDNEPLAASNYASVFGRNVYLVGFVINPTAFHLGCSPDRRVYDPDSENPLGLLEIKCPDTDSVSNCMYLATSNSGLKLKKTHEYYYQVMGQMGITGAPWCDLFVQAKNDFHCERISFDSDFFSEMKSKLDLFYFSYLLPSFTDV